MGNVISGMSDGNLKKCMCKGSGRVAGHVCPQCFARKFDLSRLDAPSGEGHRRLGERELTDLRPSELVLHRYHQAYGVRTPVVLAALMEDIEDAKRLHQSRRR